MKIYIDAKQKYCAKLKEYLAHKNGKHAHYADYMQIIKA